MINSFQFKLIIRQQANMRS